MSPHLLVSFRYLLGFLLLLLFLYAGNLIVAAVRAPVPGSVVGMLLLTAALRFRLVPLPTVQPAAGLLIRYMGLLFVPPGVGLMLYFGLIQDEWPAIVAASVVSWLTVLLVVGFMQQRLEADA